MANSKKSAAQKKDNKLTILLIVGFIIIAAFVVLYFINSNSNKDKLANNPYGKDDLKQSTIDILNDKNYQNIILPDELEKKISSGKKKSSISFSPIALTVKKSRQF